MQANETRLQVILEGTKQYVVPLFQRTYSWTNKEWETLWDDLIELAESENPKTHFIGSIVTMPAVSVPEGIAKYLLIDGQQRLTTIFILLTLLRNKAKDNIDNESADEINETLLVNRFKKDNEYYKLLPTQVDRGSYYNMINGQQQEKDNPVTQAYLYFEKRLKQSRLPHDVIKKIITHNFSIVSIVLDVDDNPYLVFESLNAKGRLLTQADLIRNYFFMRIDINDQEDLYQKYWNPMQLELKDSLTEYIRHFLMSDGRNVKQSDVYYELKDNVSPSNVIDYLIRLKIYSSFYNKFINPEAESDADIRRLFIRLKRIEVTTVYPFLLNVYGAYNEGKITKAELVEVISVLENFLIRRFICNVPTNQLGKIFVSLYQQILINFKDDCVNGVKSILQNKGYPKDAEFFERFKDAKLYGISDRQTKTRLILETLEDSYQHKEVISFDGASIEHVMPQKLTEWWKNNLDHDWEETHQLYLHTIGNLTLTAYNQELSNSSFVDKKNIYQNSHYEMNKYFLSCDSWNKIEIENRSAELASMALRIWKYFGKEGADFSDPKDATGTSPKQLIILGQEFKVDSWRDVLESTLNTISDLEPEKFDILEKEFPKYIGKDKTKFRLPRMLQNGSYIEVNLNAKTIQRFCFQAIENINLSSEEWEVITN